MMQQVPFHLSTLEMLRISIDYVALFLYIENISVVVDVLHSFTLTQFVWARDARATTANHYCTDCSPTFATES
jgi:hypothetical protein